MFPALCFALVLVLVLVGSGDFASVFFYLLVDNAETIFHCSVFFSVFRTLFFFFFFFPGEILVLWFSSSPVVVVFVVLVAALLREKCECAGEGKERAT